MNITKTDLEFLFSYLNKEDCIYDLSGSLKRIASNSDFTGTEETRQTLLKSGTAIEGTRYAFEELEDVLNDVKHDLNNVLTQQQMFTLLDDVVLRNYKTFSYKDKTNIIEYFLQYDDIKGNIFNTLENSSKELVVINLWLKDTYKQYSKKDNNDFAIPTWLNHISDVYLESFINDKRFSNKTFFKLLAKCPKDELEKFINTREGTLKDSEYFFELKENIFSDKRDDIKLTYKSEHSIKLESILEYNFAEFFYKKNILLEKEKNNFYKYIQAYVYNQTQVSMQERDEKTPKNTIYFKLNSKLALLDESIEQEGYRPYIDLHSINYNKKNIYNAINDIFKISECKEFKEFLSEYSPENDKYGEEINRDLFNYMEKSYQKHLEMLEANAKKNIINNIILQFEPQKTNEDEDNKYSSAFKI